MLTNQQKKYLITIYILGQNGGKIRMTDIANKLGVAKASVVKMTNKLMNEGFIAKEPYRQIALTQQGVLAANKLFTACVILSEFFTSKVGIEREKADKAGMIISGELEEETLDKISGYVLSLMNN